MKCRNPFQFCQNAFPCGGHVRLQYQCRNVQKVFLFRKVYVGEASVVIATSAPHRHDAIKATEKAIDYLKSKVPVWKKVSTFSKNSFPVFYFLTVSCKDRTFTALLALSSVLQFVVIISYCFHLITGSIH